MERLISLSRSVLMVLALAPVSLYAQELFDFGFKAGVNSDDLSLSDVSTDQVVGWHAGVFARLKPPLFPGVQGEALFSTVGGDATAPGGTVNVRLNYLQLPVFLVFSIGPVELHAGGYYATPISSSVRGTLGSLDGAMLDDPGTDHGLVGGAGLHLGRFYAGVRYNYGLQDLNTGAGPDVHTRQGQLYMGFGLFK